MKFINRTSIPMSTISSTTVYWHGVSQTTKGCYYSTVGNFNGTARCATSPVSWYSKCWGIEAVH